MEFRDIRELYEQLDYWREFKPHSVSDNMLKVNKIRSIKHEIATKIDVDDYREYVLER